MTHEEKVLQISALCLRVKIEMKEASGDQKDSSVVVRKAFPGKGRNEKNIIFVIHSKDDCLLSDLFDKEYLALANLRHTKANL